MKATFETEDQIEMNRIVKCTDMVLFIFELTTNMKKRLIRKYEDTDDVKVSAIQEVYDEIYSELENLNIDIDNLLN